MSERVHRLKCVRPFFDDVAEGRKTFEVRRHDRGFQVGDLLELREWPPENDGHGDCLSDCSLAPDVFTARVTYILRGGEFGVEPGFVVLGLDNYEPPVSGFPEQGDSERP